MLNDVGKLQWCGIRSTFSTTFLKHVSHDDVLIDVQDALVESLFTFTLELTRFMLRADLLYTAMPWAFGTLLYQNDDSDRAFWTG